MTIPLGRYWQLLSQYLRVLWRPVTLLALLLFGSVGLALGKPQIMRVFIDAARAGAPAQLLTQAALAFIAITIVEQVMQLAAAHLGENIGWRATNALRLDLARHVLGLDMQFHNTHTPGEMIERIDGDVTALANFFARFVLVVLRNAVLLIGILVLLFRESWLIGASVGFLALLGLFAINYSRVVAAPAWLEGRQTSGDLAGFFEERLAGLDDIRANGASAYKMRLLYELMRKMYLAYRRARILSNFTSNSGFILQTLATVVSVGVGSWLFYQGEMTIGTVFLVVYYARLMAWPLREMVSQVEDLQRAEASIQRVDELTHVSSTIQHGPGAELPTAETSPNALPVEFDDVSFAYSANMPVLDRVSFRLAPGRTLGLLGRTGSGKTTLSRLLFRQYDARSGEVRVGGVDVRQPRLDHLRRCIGLVTQEVQLFRASVRDNLTFYDRSIPDERIWAAIESLGLRDWFSRLPEGLDTTLATSGSSLSAGEAQLVAFTRVALRDPGLIILDEASSRLDPATERLIEGAVHRLLSGRTGIIIAHRLSTVERVDDILILEAGQVVEHGPRQQLAADPRSRFSRLLQRAERGADAELQEVLA